MGMMKATDTQIDDTLFLGMHRFRWLATAESTGGVFSCAQITALRGGEPPPHTHHREDQAFLVTDGRVTLTVGDETRSLGAGELMWCPKGVQHAFAIETERATMIEMSTPGGLEGAFLELSMPNEVGADLPPLQGPPPAEAIEALVTTFGRYGIEFATH